MKRIVAYVARWIRGGYSSQHSFIRDENRGRQDWIENFLIGESDMDARWYYERRRWLA